MEMCDVRCAMLLISGLVRLILDFGVGARGVGFERREKRGVGVEGSGAEV